MTETRHKKPYVPGMYPQKRTSAVKMADQCIREWEAQKEAEKKAEEKARFAEHFIENTHYISFSRKIGVGALEIADILAEKMQMKAVDREILENIAETHSVGTKTLDTFDERYPGLMNEFGSLIFGEKSFTRGDYMRQLAAAVLQIAETGPTIFVGRATHLILPRENVLAVRLISSPAHRARRLSAMFNISEAEAGKILAEEDRRQRDFFKKNLHLKDAPAYEFDLVINRDYIPDAYHAADIVQYAFTLKFGATRTGRKCA